MAEEPDDEATDAVLKEMRAVLGRFQKCFKLEPCSPELQDMLRFRKLIELLYKKAGHKKVYSHKFWNMVEAVDHRWQGLHVCKIITNLVDRFTKNIPAGPCVKLNKHYTAINKGDALTDSQTALLKLLEKPEAVKKDAQWSKYSDDLDRVITKDTAKSLSSNSVVDADAFGWIKFLDYHHQVLAWRLQYEKGFDHFTHWVHSMNNDELTKKLEVMSCSYSRPVTADVLLKADKKRKVNARQKQHRAQKKNASGNV